MKEPAVTVEVWLRGPVDGIDALLMPAAHAFLQVREDVETLLEGLSIAQIWHRPGTSASMGYHALHLAGATDRLLTYARGASLTEAELLAMRAREREADALPASEIIARTRAAMDAALTQLRAIDTATLTDPREVGRQKLPSTVLGLIFHAAEHATRHAGQMATLRRVIPELEN